MNPIHNIIGIILAAGASSRMGRSKALLTFDDGETLLTRQAKFLSENGGMKVGVVVGADSKLIRSMHPSLDVGWIENEHWEIGQFSSIQKGFSYAASNGADGVILLPVDVVGVSDAVVAALIETALRNPHLEAIIPEYDGRGGHPIYVSKNFCMRVIDLDPRGRDARLDHELSRTKNLLRLPVNDSNVVGNINTIEEWSSLA